MTGREILYMSDKAGLLTGGIASQSAQKKAREGRTEGKLEMMVSSMMHKVGIPVNVKGYRYLREAVLISAYDMDILNAVTKELYPEISGRFGVTAASVERAIRHAIDLAWEHGYLYDPQNYFGCKGRWAKRKPTNKQFIAMFADRVDLGLGSVL